MSVTPTVPRTSSSGATSWHGGDVAHTGACPTVSGDANGHGTHFAGIVAAAANNGVGVAGVAPGVAIYVHRTLDSSGVGLASERVAAVYVQADTPATRVINFSLSSTNDSATQQDAIRYALDRGKVIVAAAGNNGDSTPEFPAAYDSVIAVAAVGPAGTRASYSNFGAYVRNGIAAPGGSGIGGDDPDQNIVSTYPRSLTGSFGYRALAGTSMAAPFVFGAVGPKPSASSDLTRDDVVAILAGSA
jgi:thermitase